MQVDAALVPASDSPSAGTSRWPVSQYPDLPGPAGRQHRLQAGRAPVWWGGGGTCLQGLEYPSNDLSRGCKPEDIVDLVVITLQAHT